MFGRALLFLWCLILGAHTHGVETAAGANPVLLTLVGETHGHPDSQKRKVALYTEAAAGRIVVAAEGQFFNEVFEPKELELLGVKLTKDSRLFGIDHSLVSAVVGLGLTLPKINAALLDRGLGRDLSGDLAFNFYAFLMSDQVFLGRSLEALAADDKFFAKREKFLKAWGDVSPEKAKVVYGELLKQLQSKELRELVADHLNATARTKATATARLKKAMEQVMVGDAGLPATYAVLAAASEETALRLEEAMKNAKELDHAGRKSVERVLEKLRILDNEDDVVATLKALKPEALLMQDVLITQRNRIMTEQILAAIAVGRDEKKKVYAIVGKSHVDGIQKLLLDSKKVTAAELNVEYSDKPNR